MPVPMQTLCRAPEAPVKGESSAQAQLQPEPGRLFHEAHCLVDGQHRAILLVVPGLDVGDAAAVGVLDRLELQRHREAAAARLPTNSGQPLPDEGRVLDRPLEVRHTEPTALAVDRGKERIGQEAGYLDPVLLPLLERLWR